MRWRIDGAKRRFNLVSRDLSPFREGEQESFDWDLFAHHVRCERGAQERDPEVISQIAPGINSSEGYPLRKLLGVDLTLSLSDRLP